MANHRTALRGAAETALRKHSRIRRMTFIRAWASGVDEPTLPVVTVATPREQSGRGAKDTLQRSVTLSVIVKRAGNETIEAELDLDAEAIEVAVFPAIVPLCVDVELDQTEIRMEGTGERRIGLVEVRFACLFFTDAVA